ncbi:MAG: hypothetical protein R2746_04440 [Acidimicrobiales bacterium]
MVPERLALALACRGDVERVVDVDGDGPGFVRALERIDVDAVDVPVAGLRRRGRQRRRGPRPGRRLHPHRARGPGQLGAAARWPAPPAWTSGRWPAPGAWYPTACGPLVGRLAGAATAPWERHHDHLPIGLVDRLVALRGPRRWPTACGAPTPPTPPSCGAETVEDQAVTSRDPVPPSSISYPDELPITARRQDLLEAISANQVVVVAGETDRARAPSSQAVPGAGSGRGRTHRTPSRGGWRRGHRRAGGRGARHRARGHRGLRCASPTGSAPPPT